MSITWVVVFVALLPLTAALICRLDDAVEAERFTLRALVNVLLMWGVGWLLVDLLDSPPGADAWLLLVAGWGWVGYTWVADVSQRAGALVDSRLHQ